MTLNPADEPVRAEQPATSLPKAPSVEAIRIALERAWQADTSYDPANWSPQNPAWGQCAVTACVVQDLLGGEIVRSEAILPDGRTIPHYFNRPGAGSDSDLDFTKIQFPEGTVIPEGQPNPKTFASTREYVLSVEATRRRYLILRERVLAALLSLIE